MHMLPSLDRSLIAGMRVIIATNSRPLCLPPVTGCDASATPVRRAPVSETGRAGPVAPQSPSRARSYNAAPQGECMLRLTTTRPGH